MRESVPQNGNFEVEGLSIEVFADGPWMGGRRLASLSGPSPSPKPLASPSQRPLRRKRPPGLSRRVP